MAEPEKRRGEITREAILVAAEVNFADHGFDGARIDAIAETSGYNKTLIFRYFGDKQGLYIEVLKRADREVDALLARVFAPLLEDEDAVIDAHRFRTFLVTMIQTLFDYLIEHPRLVRMLSWEMAEGWQTVNQIASQFPPETVEQFEMLFHRARNAGLLRSGFVPVLQLATVTQMCVTYLASLPLYQALLPKEDISSVESLVRAREHIVNVVVTGMMFNPAETKPEKGF